MSRGAAAERGGERKGGGAAEGNRPRAQPGAPFFHPIPARKGARASSASSGPGNGRGPREDQGRRPPSPVGRADRQGGGPPPPPSPLSLSLSLSPPRSAPLTLIRWATSWAASMAAYGDDSSRSAFTFMPPVTRQRVSWRGREGRGRWGAGVSEKKRARDRGRRRRKQGAPPPAPPPDLPAPPTSTRQPTNQANQRRTRRTPRGPPSPSLSLSPAPPSRTLPDRSVTCTKVSLKEA